MMVCGRVEDPVREYNQRIADSQPLHFDGSIHRSASHGEHIVSPTRNLPLQRKQLKIKGPLGEPDECNGDHCQRSAVEHQSRVGPGAAKEIGQR